ncbi:MAG: FAD-binding protein [Coriobacteriia bacterium]|nr:FAD-binding protein [Coriobacteriia bacterium]
MSTSTPQLTRRSFVKSAGVAGALVAGATVAAGSALADETSTAATEVSSAPDYSSWLGEEPKISDADVSEELSADVIVIGLADSGIPAVRAAVEEGATVLAFERCENYTATGGDVAVLGGSIQERYGRGEGFLDKREIAAEHQKECSYHTKLPIFKRWADEMGDMLDWFVDASGSYITEETFSEVPEENRDNYLYPYFVPMLESYDYTKEQMPCYPTSLGFSNLTAALGGNLDKAVEEAGDKLTIRYNHIAEKLIMEDGRCTGVYVRNIETGAYVKAMANKGVILATGDYSSNKAMLKYFVPSAVENDIQTLWIWHDSEGNATNDGSGIKMGVWAGAQVQQWHAPNGHHMGGGAGPDGHGVMGNNGWLWINLNGERFMNEDLPGQQLENQVELQPGHKAYQIFDAAWPEELQYFPAAHGVACIYSDEAYPEWMNSNQLINVRTPADLQSALDDGRCLTADTLAELLAQIDGMNVEAAKATIEHYNELCAAGEDTDFGKSSQRLFALQNPPYYAVECGQALLLVCNSGLESDENCHTFDADRNVIPGLYVCGNMQGNRFAVEYPISLKGLSVSMALFYGYIAGKNAAQGL